MAADKVAAVQEPAAAAAAPAMERSRSRNASRSTISGSKDLLQQQQHGVAGPAKFRDVSPPREDAHPLPAAASASAAAAAAAAAWHYHRPATGSAAAAAAALQHLVMDQRGSSGRKKSSSSSGGAAGTGAAAAAARDAVRDLSGIRREDVERKREEIGKERPSWQLPLRVRDENERRKEALALLRMKLEAHVRRTTDKGLREWSRDQAAGGGGGVVNSSKPAAAAGVKNSGSLNDDDWGARVLRKLANDDFSNRKSAGGGRGRAAAAAQAAADEEAIVVVSGTPPAVDADAADMRLSAVADADAAAAPTAGAAEEGNVTVKDIYFVESVKQRAPPPGGDGHEEAECETAEEESEKKSYAAAAPAAVVEEARVPVSSNHLKLAEKVAKLMEDLDSPADDDADQQQQQHQQQPHQAMGTTPGGLASARLKLRVIDGGDAGPIVLMKCSSRDHARVVCETLSAQLGPAQETIVTSTAQGRPKRQQQHHFQFQGTNRLASFLRKAFSSATAPSSAAPSRSSTARFRQPPPVDTNVNGGGSSAASTDDVSGATATTFDSSTGSFFSREAKDAAAAANRSGSPPDRESAAAGGRRRVRSANASPVPSLVHGGKATTGGGGYLARFLATPARKPSNLDRTRSVGRSNDDDATTGAASRASSKFKGSRLFSFASPSRGVKKQQQQQHRFEDRLGPGGGDGDGFSAAAAAGKHKFRDRLLSFTSPARRRNKKSDHSGGGTGAGSTADGHSHADNRDRWSGLLGSPTGAGGVGTFSGPPASSDQSWGFLGGLGSPVRDAAGTRKSGGTGWGPVYSLTDVDVPVGGAGAGDGTGGDGAGAGGPGQELQEEPTSPQVTCIGRVKAKAPRCNGAATGTQQHHRQQQHVHSFSGPDASVAPLPAPGAHRWTDSSARPNNVNTKPPPVPHHLQHHHSGPVFSTASFSHHQQQPKASRWRSLLGLYRSHGPSARRGSPPARAPAAPAEAETAAEAVDAAAVDPHDVCLSRCRKTSFQRFAASGGGTEGPDNPTAAAAAAPGTRPPQFLLGHKAESTASSRARDSVQAWLEGAADPEDLENAQLEEERRAGTGGGGGGSGAEHVYGQQQGGAGVVVLGGDRDGKEQHQQSLLWQRRQFTRPKTLDIEPAGTTGTGSPPRPMSE